MIEVSSNIKDFERMLSDIGRKQLPYAMALALTDTAKAVRTAEVEEMRRSFDRPTPFTLAAFQVKPATKQTMVARVEPKKTRKGRHYLKTEATGGPRPKTGFETLLESKLPYSGILRSVIPADNARLNKYGNWSRGQMNQALSSLHAQLDPFANTTSASRKRNQGRLTYFVPKHGLTPGIYSRNNRGDIGIVAIFTETAPTYKVRFDFLGVAEKTAREVFPDALAKRFRLALSTAR